jgi:hypothetical protein
MPREFEFRSDNQFSASSNFFDAIFRVVPRVRTQSYGKHLAETKSLVPLYNTDFRAKITENTPKYAKAEIDYPTNF